MGFNAPAVCAEITVLAQVLVWAVIFQKWLPKLQVRFQCALEYFGKVRGNYSRLQCGAKCCRSVCGNHSLGSSVGRNDPEVFAEIAV